MALHEYPELEQGTQEWLDARCGRITASVVGQLISSERPDPAGFPCTDCESGPESACISLRGGKPMKTYHSARTLVAAAHPPQLVTADTDTARGLILTLAAERITGHVEETYPNRDMQRGKEEEPFARDAYAAAFGEVVELGFMVRDDWGFEIGYSPDGLVGDDGLIEIKSRRAKTHVRIVLDGQVPAENMAQIQCGLLVSGRSWCDYVDYSNGMHLFPVRVEPDPAWFDAILESACAAEESIHDIITRYKEATAGLVATERIIDLEEMRIA